jgi:hypothetical protein
MSNHAGDPGLRRENTKNRRGSVWQVLFLLFGHLHRDEKSL